MGGCSVLVIMAVFAAVGVAVIAATFAGFAFFAAGVAIAIVFAVLNKKRREQGKEWGALWALPIALIAVGIATLLWLGFEFYFPVMFTN